MSSWKPYTIEITTLIPHSQYHKHRKKWEGRLNGALQQVIEWLIQCWKERWENRLRNKTTQLLLLLGTIGWALIHFFHPLIGFQVSDFQNPLRISTFNGDEAPCKNEVSFEQWIFEVRSVQGLSSEPVLRDAVINH